MKYIQIEKQLDLNDPELGFNYRSQNDELILSITDWRNREIEFTFSTVYSFSYRIRNGYNDWPDAQFIEIIDSTIILDLKSDSSASQEEELHHYLISTNEDEWCEIVANKYKIKTKD